MYIYIYSISKFHKFQLLVKLKNDFFQTFPRSFPEVFSTPSKQRGMKREKRNEWRARHENATYFSVK